MVQSSSFCSMMWAGHWQPAWPLELQRKISHFSLVKQPHNSVLDRNGNCPLLVAECSTCNSLPAQRSFCHLLCTSLKCEMTTALKILDVEAAKLHHTTHTISLPLLSERRRENAWNRGQGLREGQGDDSQLLPWADPTQCREMNR